MSMFVLATVLFFSVTGLTLNHPDWFAETERRESIQGRMRVEWLRLQGPVGSPSGEVDELRRVSQLEIVEYLRKVHGVYGAVAEFLADEKECTVTFEGLGFAADAYIDRETARYDLTQSSHGLVAVINDLHKGRDTCKSWSAVIDASAIVLTVISLTGLVLLFYLKRKRIPGLLMVFGGTVAVAAVVILLVP